MAIPTETITKPETPSKANEVRTAVPHSMDEFNPYHYISASLWHLHCHFSFVRPNFCMYIRAKDKGRHVTTAALGVGEVFFLDPILIVLVLFIFALAKGVLTWAYWDGFLFTV